MSLLQTIYCSSGHGLTKSSKASPWQCNARDEPGGCKCNQQTEGKLRWRCDICDFDYCGPCHDGKVAEMTRTFSFSPTSTSAGGDGADLYKVLTRDDVLIELVQRGIMARHINSSTSIKDLKGMLVSYDSRHGTSVPKPKVRWVGPFASEWTCPRCDEVRYTETCSPCAVEKSVVGMAHIHPIFEKVESLYFEIINSHLEHVSSPPTTKGARLAELRTKTANLLNNNSEVIELQKRNWTVKPCIERVLNMSLDLIVSAEPLIIDTNSESLFLAFVKRVHEKHKAEYNVKSELLLSLENISKASTKWTCALCSVEISSLEEICHSCKVNSQTFKLLHLSNQVRNRDSVKAFVRTCCKGFDINLGVVSGPDASKSPKVLREEYLVECRHFLEDHDTCMHFESAGFLIRRHLDAFFCRILKGERSFPWAVTCYVEQNSVALYAFFVKALIEEVSKNHLYRGKILVDCPKPVKDIDEEFDPTSKSRKRSKECARFLYQSSRMLSHICRAIAFSASDVDWTQLGEVQENMKRQFNMDITLLVDLLKVAVRDYGTLVKDLLAADEDRYCIAESMLDRVLALEKTIVTENVTNVDITTVVIVDPFAFKSSNLEPAGGTALVPVAYSLLFSINQALLSIKNTMGENKTIETLTTILRNIVEKPTVERFREINSGSTYFKQHIGEVPGGMDFLTTIGFVAESPMKLKLKSADLKLVYIGYDKVKALQDTAEGGQTSFNDVQDIFSDDYFFADVLLCMRGTAQMESSDTIHYDETKSRITLLSLTDGLAGALTPSVGSLARLQYLHLTRTVGTGEAATGGRGIGGCLPFELGQLSCLLEMNLGGNSFEGILPSSIGLCVNLTLLSLESNQFQGPIPLSFGNLVKCAQLNLENNKLSGSVFPTMLGNLVDMVECKLTRNQFDDRKVPICFGNLKKFHSSSFFSKSSREDGLDVFKASFEVFSIAHLYDQDPALMTISKDLFDFLCEAPAKSRDQNPFLAFAFDGAVAEDHRRKNLEKLLSLNPNPIRKASAPLSDELGRLTASPITSMLTKPLHTAYHVIKYKYYSAQYDKEEAKVSPVAEHINYLADKLSEVEAKLPDTDIDAEAAKITSLYVTQQDFIKELVALRNAKKRTDTAGRKCIQDVIDEINKLKIKQNGEVPSVGEELGNFSSRGGAAEGGGMGVDIHALRDRLVSHNLASSVRRPIMIDWNDLEVIDPSSDPNIPDPNICGRGSYGLVVKARLKLRGYSQAVAVKILHPNVQFEHNRAAALQEYEMVTDASRRIKNKDSIVNILGLAEGILPPSFQGFFMGFPRTKVCGIVMRLEAGGSIKDLLKTERWRTMRTYDKLDIILQIARGLTELHEIGIVHGDIKPANVLLNHSYPPIVRLCDFGQSIANKLTSLDSTNSNPNVQSVLINTTTQRGSPIYSAPELLASKSVSGYSTKPTRSTDMYSFGVLCWEILCKVPTTPFVGNNTGMSEAELVKKVVVYNERPDINEVLKNVPQEIKDMIIKCWDRVRVERPKALQAFMILDQCCNQLSNSHYDIFLSHPWTTKPVMRQVKRQLNLLGYKVWYDEINMQWDLQDSMRDGINKSKVVLACVSPAFEKSKFCMFELNEARKINKTIFALVTEQHPFPDVKANAPGWAGKILDHGNLRVLCDMDNKMFIDIGEICALPGWDEKDDSLIPQANLEKLREKVDQLVGVLQCSQASCFPSGSPCNSL